MFSIWSTVVMVCRRNATSVISRLFLAMRMKRLLGAKPKPCSKCWVSWNLKPDAKVGLIRVNGLLLVILELENQTNRLVPD